MKFSELIRALPNLPIWLQVVWGLWGVGGITLLFVSANMLKATPNGQQLFDAELDTNITERYKPPIFGLINVNLPYGYFMQACANDGNREFNVYAQPTRSIIPPLSAHSQDIILEFDITNPNAMSLRIIHLYVEVLEFISVTVDTTTPVAAAGRVRRFFCNIRNSKGLYQAENAADNFDFIKLTEGELERMAIHVNTPDQGIYSLSIKLEYAIGEDSYREDVGRVPRMVGFFEKR